jgi:hypothetical protein
MARHAGTHPGRACAWCGIPLGWWRYWWTDIFNTRPYCGDCSTGKSPHARWARRPRETPATENSMAVNQCMTAIYDHSGSAPERCALPEAHEGECEP